MGFFGVMMSQWGIPSWAFGILAVIFIWSYAWKLAALWKSARKGSIVWFIVLALVNTVGILEILYIFVFSEMKMKHRTQRKMRKRR